METKGYPVEPETEELFLDFGDEDIRALPHDILLEGD